MAKENKGVILQTPKQVWEYFCDVNFYDYGDEESVEYQVVQKQITELLPKFTEEELQLAIQNSNKTPKLTFFTEAYINSILDNVSLKEQLKEAKTLDAKAGKDIDLLTKTVAEVLKASVQNVVLDDIDEIVKERYGSIQRKVEWISLDEKKIEGVVHEKFEDVSQWIQLNEPVMLVGPAGSGKNVLCTQLAKAFNMEFYIVNAVKNAYELTGFVDGNGKYQDTPLYKAFKSSNEGKNVIFVFDEFDGSESEAVIVFNDAVSSKKFTFPNGETLNGENIRFMACANTYGTGATLDYVGRNPLDGASLNRFTIESIGYSTQIEENICPDNSELLEFIRDFRNQVFNHSIHHIVSYRNLRQLYNLFKKFPNRDIKSALKSALVKNLEPNDLSTISYELNGNNKYAKVIKEMAKEH